MIFCLTKAGKRAYKDSSANADELRILEYLYPDHSASKEELENIGGLEARWGLKKHNLIKELS